MGISFATSDLQSFYPDYLLMKMGRVIFFVEVQKISGLFAVIQNAALYFGLAILGMDTVLDVAGSGID